MLPLEHGTLRTQDRVAACVFRFGMPLLCELRSNRFLDAVALLGAGAVDAKQPSTICTRMTQRSAATSS